MRRLYFIGLEDYLYYSILNQLAKKSNSEMTMGININDGFTDLDTILHTKTRNIILDRLKKARFEGHHKVDVYVRNTLLRSGAEEGELDGIISKLNNPMDKSIEKNFVLDLLAQRLRSRRNYESLGIYVMNNTLRYSGINVEKLPNTGDGSYVMLEDGRVEMLGDLKMYHSGKEISKMSQVRVGTMDAKATLPSPDGRNVWISFKHFGRQGGYQDNGLHEVDSLVRCSDGSNSDDIFAVVLEGNYGRKSVIRSGVKSIAGDSVQVAEKLLNKMGMEIHPSVDPYHVSDAFIRNLVYRSIPEKSSSVSRELNSFLVQAVDAELEMFKSMSSTDRAKSIRGKLVNLSMSAVDDEYVNTISDMLASNRSVYSRIMFNYLVPNPERKKIYEKDFIDKCVESGLDIKKLDETGKKSMYLRTGRIVEKTEFDEIKPFYNNGKTTKSLDFEITIGGTSVYGFHKYSSSVGTEVDESLDFVQYMNEWARNTENKNKFMVMVLEGPSMDKSIIHDIRERARSVQGDRYRNVIIGDSAHVMKSLMKIAGPSITRDMGAQRSPSLDENSMTDDVHEPRMGM